MVMVVHFGNFFCDNFLWMLFSFIVCLVCLMDLRFDSSSISFTFGRKKSIALDAKNPDQNVNIFSYTQIRLLQSFFSKPFFRRIFFFFKAEFFFFTIDPCHHPKNNFENYEIYLITV